MPVIPDANVCRIVKSCAHIDAGCAALPTYPSVHSFGMCHQPLAALLTHLPGSNTRWCTVRSYLLPYQATLHKNAAHRQQQSASGSAFFLYANKLGMQPLLYSLPQSSRKCTAFLNLGTIACALIVLQANYTFTGVQTAAYYV